MSVFKKYNTLVFLENEEQYYEFQNHKHNDLNYIICPLTPFSLNLCEKNKDNFVMPHEFISEEDFFNCKQISEAKINHIVELLNQHFTNISNEEINFPLEIGNYFYNLIYLAVGALHHKAFLLSRVIDNINPDSIFVFRLRGAEQMIHAFIRNPVGIYAELLENSFYKSLCRYIDFSVPREESKISIMSIANEFGKTILKKIPLFYQTFTLRQNGINIAQRHKGGSGMKVMLIGGIYNWKQVINKLMDNSNIGISLYNGDCLPKPQSRSTRGALDEKLKLDCEFMKFNVTEIIRRQINIIEGTFRDMLKSFGRDKKKVAGTDILLASVLAWPQQAYMSHIATSLGKPVLIYQHGEQNIHNYKHLFVEASEVHYVDYYLSFGEGVNRAYSKYVGYKTFKGIVSVGSTALDKLKSVHPNVNKHILYATGKYFLNSMPLVDAVGGLSYMEILCDKGLYERQKRILAYLELVTQSHPSYKVIFKINTSPGYDKFPFKSDRFRIVQHEKTFTELLPEASVVILDAPSTTCLEVCSTFLPLFLVASNMNPEAKELLKKRAIVAETSDDLVNKVEDYLKTGVYPADLTNRDFIKAYGTYSDDGNSVDKAIDFMHSILKKKSLKQSNSEYATK